MRELAQAHRAGHSGAALERVQRPAQLLRDLRVARTATPPPHFFSGLRIELRRFFEEDLQHLRVDVVSNAGKRIARFLRRPDLDFLLRAMRRCDCGYKNGVVMRRRV